MHDAITALRDQQAELADAADTDLSAIGPDAEAVLRLVPILA